MSGHDSALRSVPFVSLALTWGWKCRLCMDFDRVFFHPVLGGFLVVDFPGSSLSFAGLGARLVGGRSGVTETPGVTCLMRAARLTTASRCPLDSNEIRRGRFVLGSFRWNHLAPVTFSLGKNGTTGRSNLSAVCTGPSGVGQSP
jgi:hypothetical protein